MHADIRAAWELLRGSLDERDLSPALQVLIGEIDAELSSPAGLDDPAQWRVAVNRAVALIEELHGEEAEAFARRLKGDKERSAFARVVVATLERRRRFSPEEAD